MLSLVFFVSSSDLQVEAGHAPQDHHRDSQHDVRAELEEPEGRPTEAHLQGHHGPQVEHAQERAGADGQGVLVVRVEPIVQSPVWGVRAPTWKRMRRPHFSFDR